jgi:TP901 family phage tail tape measure protein
MPDQSIELIADLKLQKPTTAERQIREIERNLFKGSGRAGEPLGRLTGKVSEFDKSLEAANARVIAFGASAAIITTVTTALTQMVVQSIRVEKVLLDINVLLGQSSSSLSKFSDSLFEVAKNTGQSFFDVAEAAKEFSRQGLGVQETLSRTADAMILTRLTGLDLVKSVEQLTASVNQFSKEGITTADVINRLANVDAKFAVSAKDLSEGLSRAGSVAQDAGASFNELIALVTAVQQRTARGGAVIGNALKTIFTRVSRSDTLDSLEKLGIGVRDLEGNTLPAIRILSELSQKYDEMSSSQRAFTSELVGGGYQINIVKSLFDDLGRTVPEYAKALDVAGRSTDEAYQRNELLNKSFASLANEAGQNLTKLAASFGSLTFGPALKNIFSVINGAGDSIDGNAFLEAGAKVGKGLITGIGDFIGGPGLIYLISLIGKLGKKFGTFAKDSLTDVLSIGAPNAKILDTQKGIVDLVNNEARAHDIVNNALLTQVQKEQQLILLIKEKVAAQAAYKNETLALSTSLVGRGVAFKPSTGQFKTKAGGHMPLPISSVPQEAIQREIVGAKQAGYNIRASDVRVMRASIDGKSTTVVYNNKEKVIHDYMGSGEPAIIPPTGRINNYFDGTTTRAFKNSLGGIGLKIKNTGSYLDYSADRASKQYLIEGVESQQKGDARTLFETLAKKAQKKGFSIESGSFIPQLDRIDPLTFDTNSKVDNLYKLFPQLRYRKGLGNTSGDVFLPTGSTSIKTPFGSLDELESLVQKQSNTKQIRFGGVSTRFAAGRIGNYAGGIARPGPSLTGTFGSLSADAGARQAFSESVYILSKKLGIPANKIASTIISDKNFRGFDAAYFQNENLIKVGAPSIKNRDTINRLKVPSVGALGRGESLGQTAGGIIAHEYFHNAYRTKQEAALGFAKENGLFIPRDARHALDYLQDVKGYSKHSSREYKSYAIEEALATQFGKVIGFTQHAGGHMPDYKNFAASPKIPKQLDYIKNNQKLGGVEFKKKGGALILDMVTSGRDAEGNRLKGTGILDFAFKQLFSIAQKSGIKEVGMTPINGRVINKAQRLFGTRDSRGKPIDFGNDIRLNVAKYAGKVMNAAGGSFNPARVIKQGGFVKGANKPTLSGMGEILSSIGIKGDFKSASGIEAALRDKSSKKKLFDYLKSRPISVSSFPDKYFEIGDGNHRKALADLAGIKNIPSYLNAAGGLSAQRNLIRLPKGFEAKKSGPKTLKEKLADAYASANVAAQKFAIKANPYAAYADDAIGFVRGMFGFSGGYMNAALGFSSAELQGMSKKDLLTTAQQLGIPITPEIKKSNAASLAKLISGSKQHKQLVSQERRVKAREGAALSSNLATTRGFQAQLKLTDTDAVGRPININRVTPPPTEAQKLAELERVVNPGAFSPYSKAQLALGQAESANPSLPQRTPEELIQRKIQGAKIRAERAESVRQRAIANARARLASRDIISGAAAAGMTANRAPSRLSGLGLPIQSGPNPVLTPRAIELAKERQMVSNRVRNERGSRLTSSQLEQLRAESGSGLKTRQAQEAARQKAYAGSVEGVAARLTTAGIANPISSTYQQAPLIPFLGRPGAPGAAPGTAAAQGGRGGSSGGGPPIIPPVVPPSGDSPQKRSLLSRATSFEKPERNARFSSGAFALSFAAPLIGGVAAETFGSKDPSDQRSNRKIQGIASGIGTGAALGAIVGGPLGAGIGLAVAGFTSLKAILDNTVLSFDDLNEKSKIQSEASQRIISGIAGYANALETLQNESLDPNQRRSVERQGQKSLSLLSQADKEELIAAGTDFKKIQEINSRQSERASRADAGLELPKLVNSLRSKKGDGLGNSILLSTILEAGKPNEEIDEKELDRNLAELKKLPNQRDAVKGISSQSDAYRRLQELKSQKTEKREAVLTTLGLKPSDIAEFTSQINQASEAQRDEFDKLLLSVKKGLNTRDAFKAFSANLVEAQKDTSKSLSSIRRSINTESLAGQRASELDSIKKDGSRSRASSVSDLTFSTLRSRLSDAEPYLSAPTSIRLQSEADIAQKTEGTNREITKLNEDRAKAIQGSLSETKRILTEIPDGVINKINDRKGALGLVEKVGGAKTSTAALESISKFGALIKDSEDPETKAFYEKLLELSKQQKSALEGIEEKSIETVNQLRLQLALDKAGIKSETNRQLNRKAFQTSLTQFNPIDVLKNGQQFGDIAAAAKKRVFDGLVDPSESTNQRFALRYGTAEEKRKIQDEVRAKALESSGVRARGIIQEFSSGSLSSPEEIADQRESLSKSLYLIDSPVGPDDKTRINNSRKSGGVYLEPTYGIPGLAAIPNFSKEFLAQGATLSDVEKTRESKRKQLKNDLIIQGFSAVTSQADAETSPFLDALSGGKYGYGSGLSKSISSQINSGKFRDAEQQLTALYPRLNNAGKQELGGQGGIISKLRIAQQNLEATARKADTESKKAAGGDDKPITIKFDKSAEDTINKLVPKESKTPPSISIPTTVSVTTTGGVSEKDGQQAGEAIKNQLASVTEFLSQKFGYAEVPKATA